MCDYDEKINYKLNLYKSRSLGRFGNQLFDYIFMRLLAMQHGSYFENEIIFPEPFKVPIGTFAMKQVNTGLGKYKECVPDFPMDFKYFKNNLLLIKTFFKLPVIKKKYDIVVHIRLDDVLKANEPLYTVLPLSYYKNVLEKIKKRHGSLKNFKILCISRPMNKLQEKIFKDLVDYISLITGAHVETQSGSVTEDISALMAGSIIIGSVGSFWIWPVLLSSVCNEIYVPIFGQNLAYNFFKTSNNSLKITAKKTLYKMNINLKKKIITKTLKKLMYDVDY